jgi:hypothetical protein
MFKYEVTQNYNLLFYTSMWACSGAVGHGLIPNGVLGFFH